MTTHSTRRLTINIVEDALAFATLEQEWNDLYQDTPLVTPFQSWAWLYSWWKSCGRRYELRLILVRNGEGLLKGILPLMLERRGLSEAALSLGFNHEGFAMDVKLIAKPSRSSSSRTLRRPS